VWRIVGRRAERRVHPADVMRAVTGEMSENRKAVFLKVTDQPDCFRPPEDAVELCEFLNLLVGRLLMFPIFSLFLGLCKA